VAGKMPKDYMEAYMRKMSMAVAFAAAGGLFLTSAVAQREGHDHAQADQTGQAAQSGQAAEPADKSDTGKAGGMMSGGMMSMMTKEQEDTSKLVERIMKSFAAIEAEKDPRLVKEKLAEHGALLKELEAKVQAHAQMMEMMHPLMGGSKVMGGSKMGGDDKK
jgi:hypothetical protein